MNKEVYPTTRYHRETQAELQAANRRKPFILSRAEEWKWMRSDSMMTSPDRITAGANAEELCVVSSLYTLQYLKDGFIDSYERLVGATDETNEYGEILLAKAYQKAEVRLTLETYSELHRGLMEAMPDEETFEAMTYIMLIHDIGKNPELIRAVGLDPEKGANHDEALRRLFSPEYTEQRKKFLPTYEAEDIFSERTKRLIREVMLLPVNWGGLVQSQCTSAELDKIPADTDPHVVKMSFWHWVLDAGGVLGYQNPQAALMLTEPMARIILKAKAAFLGSREELGLHPDFPLDNEMRTDLFLALRGEDFGVDFYDLIVKVRDIGAFLEIRLQQLEEITRRTEGLIDSREKARVMQEIISRHPPPLIEYGFVKTQITLADMLRYTTEEEFLPVKNGFNALPFTSQLALMLIVAIPKEISHFLYDWDYAPGLLRNLSSLPLAEGMPAALKFLLKVMTMASASSPMAVPSGYLKIEEVPYHEYLVALRDLAIAAGQPGFNLETSLKTGRYDNTIHVTTTDEQHDDEGR